MMESSTALMAYINPLCYNSSNLHTICILTINHNLLTRLQHWGMYYVEY